MYRAIPVGNKACAARVQKRNHDAHRERLKTMRPQVDTKMPGVWNLEHLRNNLKREQLLEERYFEIDRENRILLNKMSDIMKQPGYSADRAKSGPPSLNRDARKVELMRITQENQAILRRIQRCQPVYNHVAWEDDYKKSGMYLSNSCEYKPVVVRRKGPSRSSSLTPIAGAAGSPGAGGPDGQAAGGEDMRYVFKEGKKIGQQYYLVEMSTDGRTLNICAYDGDEQKTFECVVNEKNHRRLYRENNGDYSAIAEKLRVEGDKLVLEDTHIFDPASTV